MARAPSTRDRPHGSANFLVAYGSGVGGRMTGLGVAEVIFPTFAVADRHAPEPSPAEAPRLVLRRGATGALDLYAWWDRARRGKAPPRRVLEVKLLADDRETVVMTWRFHGVRPLALSYSPLQAMAGAVLMETLELAYDDVEVS